MEKCPKCKQEILKEKSREEKDREDRVRYNEEMFPDDRYGRGYWKHQGG